MERSLQKYSEKSCKIFFKKRKPDPESLCCDWALYYPKKLRSKKKFRERFLKKDKKSINFFKSINNKTYFSLNKYVYSQLKQLGIKNLEIINKDTYNKKNDFFSARRSIHNKEDDYGRNISLIMIK